MDLALLARAMRAGKRDPWPASGPHATARAMWRPRFTLVAFSFTCLALSYMDRWNLSVAAPLLMKEFGWNETTMGLLQSVFFYGFTATHLPGGWLADRLGLVWLVLWIAWSRPEPRADHGPSAAPRAGVVPWGTLLRHPAVAALLATTFVVNWTIWFVHAWLPTYLMQAHGLSLRGSGLAAALPNLAMVVAGLAAGWMAVALVARGVPVTRVRKLVLGAGFAGGVALVLGLGRAAAGRPRPTRAGAGPRSGRGRGSSGARRGRCGAGRRGTPSRPAAARRRGW